MLRLGWVSSVLAEVETDAATGAGLTVDSPAK
jgi:hypothetical protein